MTERENLLAFYRHEDHERMPNTRKTETKLSSIGGFQEHPPFNGSGVDWFGCTWIHQEGIDAPTPDPTHFVLDDI